MLFCLQHALYALCGAPADCCLRAPAFLLAKTQTHIKKSEVATHTDARCLVCVELVAQWLRKTVVCSFTIGVCSFTTGVCASYVGAVVCSFTSGVCSFTTGFCAAYGGALKLY